MEIVRVIRVLVYQGERSWVEKTLATGAVPANGRHTLGENKGVISSMTITEFPEVLEVFEDKITLLEDKDVSNS